MIGRPLAWPARLGSAGAAGLVLAPRVAHAAEGGLEIIPEPARLVVLLLLFLILVPVLDRLLFRPLLDVLDQREQRIDGARTRAAQLAQQAASLVARHGDAIQKAREIAHAEQARVVNDARGQHQAAVAEARRAAEAEIVRTRAELRRAAESVRAGLDAEAAPIAREIAQRLLGRDPA